MGFDVQKECMANYFNTLPEHFILHIPLVFVKCASFCTIVYYVQDFCTCSCDIYIVVFCNRVNSLWLLFGMLYFKDLPAAHVKEERTIRSVQSCRSDH